MPQNFLYPQRDQPLLLPVDMREWLPEDDLVFVVLDAVATLDLGGFRRRYRADGHGRAAFDPEMMVALLLYGYCQGERSSRVIEKRCVRDVGYRVITGGLHPDHATIARFRARHETALGGLFSQVLRLLAAEGMVSLGTLSLDGTKLAGNAAQKANRTLPQIDKLLAEAAAADAAEDARQGERPAAGDAAGAGPPGRAAGAAGGGPGPAGGRGSGAPRRAAGQAGSLGAAAAAGKRRGGRRPGDEPRTNRANTEPRANTTDPDVRVMRNQKGYVAGYNGQLVVTAQQVIVGAMLSQHPVDRTLLHPLLDTCRQQLAEAGITPRSCVPCSPTPATSARRTSPAPTPTGCGCWRRWPKTPAGTAPAHRKRALHLDKLPATARARRRLLHPRGRDDYKMRARTVEPVFGQLKTCQNFTMMSRRGFTACESEWLLASTAHNCASCTGTASRANCHSPSAPATT